MIVRRQLLNAGMYKGLKTPDRMIYIAMWLRCGPERTCYPSLRKIGEDTGLGRTAIVKAINRMCMLGVMKKEIDAGRPEHTIIYRLKDLEAMYNG